MLSNLQTTALLLFISLILLCCVNTGTCQVSVPDQQLRTADSLYGIGEFSAAASLYGEILNSKIVRYDVARVAVKCAKALYFGKEPGLSRDLLDEYSSEIAKSLYNSARHYFLGRIAFDEGDYLRSGESFASAFQLTSDPVLRDLCYANCRNICVGYLSAAEQRSFLTACHRTDAALFGDLIYDIARKYHELSLDRQAGKVIELYEELVGTNDAQIQELRGRIDVKLSRIIDLALLAPLSGDLSAYGRQMNAAAELAVSMHSDSLTKINLRSYDTFGNSIVASQLSRRVTSENVSAVLGPLTSQEAVGATPYSDFWSVPMVLPVASEKGLTSISGFTYQLSPTPETMGKTLAEAACEELGLDSVAILAPNDGYGRQIAEGFRRVMQENDVTVFDEVFYPRGSADYRRFMINLKEAVLPDSFDSTIYLDEAGDTLETEEIFVDIPAVFIPAYSEELKLILPQLRFYRIQTVILGSEDLGLTDIRTLPATSHYTGMFVSHNTFTESDTSWIKFEYLFHKQVGSLPTSVAGMTYDAVNLTLKAAELGGYSSDGIANGWKQLDQFDGVTGPFEFNERNENVAVPVYLLLDGQIEKWHR